MKSDGLYCQASPARVEHPGGERRVLGLWRRMCREGSLVLVAVSSVSTQSLRYIAAPLHQLTDVHIPKAAGQKVQVAILDQLLGEEGHKVVRF